MSHVHWWLFALSFVSGMALTFGLIVRSVKRQAPARRSGDESTTEIIPVAEWSPMIPDEMYWSTTIPDELESPTTMIPVGREPPTAMIPVPKDPPTTKIPVAEESPTTKIPVANEPPTTKIPAAEESPTTKIPVANEPRTTKIPVAEESPTTNIPVAKALPPAKSPPAKRTPAKRTPPGSGSPQRKRKMVPYAPFGPGSARADAKGNGPSGWIVKGRSDTRLYYTPDDATYDQTVAQVWFRDEESAARAHFTPWRTSSKK
jgi:hypothetical protein